LGIKTHFLLRKLNTLVYLIIFSITINNMTSVKKNDFAEGMITSGTGYLMTVKNLQKDDVMTMFDKYGISPRWTVFDVDLQQYKKVE
jgi:hypothetical protein